MAKTRNEEPRTIPREEQTMPCPVCGYEQTQAEYWMRPTAGDGKNDGVPCLCCGVEIRVAVPFAVICAMPFGWRWVRVSSDDGANDEAWEYALGRFVAFAAAEMGTESFLRAKTKLFRALNGLNATAAAAFFDTSAVRSRLGESYTEQLRADYNEYRVASPHKNAT